MESILQHAQELVYSLLSLMPSGYQKGSLNALLGLFLEAQGHALPEHTQVKSPSSLSRFLKRGLHLVVLYLVVGEWRVPWSFRVWRGKGHPSPAQLACKLLATVPKSLVKGRVVLVQADTEFGRVAFLNAVRQRSWRPIVGMRSNRKLQDGRCLKDLYRHAQRGLQVDLEGIDYPLTVSWFWLKRSEGKRELRFVVSTHPYSGAYLVRLGRKRWAIVACFPQGGLFQNRQAPVWTALLWSKYEVRVLSLTDSVTVGEACRRHMPVCWRIGLTNGHGHQCSTGKRPVA